MAGQGKRRRGRLILLLFLLNLLVLVAGWALERWQDRPSALNNVNADKILLLRAQEGGAKGP